MLKTNKSIRNPYIALTTGLALSGLLVAGNAAAVSTNLEVSAEVSDNCTISTAPLVFGAYDPVSTNLATPLLEDSTITVLCTTGAAAFITLDDGENGNGAVIPTRRLANAGATEFLFYELFSDTLRTLPWASDATNDVTHTGDGTSTGLQVFGRIAPNQQVSSGTYDDTVVATVLF